MRKHLRHRLRNFTAAAFALALACAGTVTVFADETGLIPLDMSMVTDSATGAATEVEIFWSDDWFREPSTEYNHELAITSIVLSGSAYLEGEGPDHTDSSMRQAFIEFGFDEGSIFFYNYDHIYTEEDSDVVAYTFASKQIDDGVLVAVVIRGTSGSELEWASDFRVGANEEGQENSEEHYGFYQAESKLAADLDDYLASLAGVYEGLTSDDLKFYVTGHSRGGSVADILASELDDTYGKDKVYAYTFAAPAVAVRAGVSGYENIFNILSADDLLSLTAFYQWGFNRFGVEKTIGASGDYDSRNDDDFMGHDPFVYYARLKSGLPDTLFE